MGKKKGIKEKELKSIQKVLNKNGYFGKNADKLLDRKNELTGEDSSPLWRP